jgi:DNA polymerase-1
MGAPKFCVYAGLFDDNGDPRLGYGQELIEKWHAAYPGIAVWHERTIQQLLRDNYIAYNIARRRRRLDVEWKINDYRAGTQAIQFRVSGSCQDLIKLAMIRIFDTRNKKVANCRPAEAKLWAQYKFLIQVHDELIFQGPKAIKEELCQLVKDSMEGVATGMRVPFTADARAGRTWDELH